MHFVCKNNSSPLPNYSVCVIVSIVSAQVSNSEQQAVRQKPHIFSDHLKGEKDWDAVDLGNCPKSESSRKWLGEGAKGLLDPASKRPLALVRNGVAPVQNRVWVVQKTLGRPLLPGPNKVKKTFCTLP